MLVCCIACKHKRICFMLCRIQSSVHKVSEGMNQIFIFYFYFIGRLGITSSCSDPDYGRPQNKLLTLYSIYNFSQIEKGAKQRDTSQSLEFQYHTINI